MKLFKRTVTLLISIILIASVLIYFLVFFSEKKSEVKSYEIKKITELLKDCDIEIKKSVIPKSYPDLPHITVTNAVHDRLSFSENLLGANFTVTDSKTYTNDEYLLVFEDNGFSVTFPEEKLLKKDFSHKNPGHYDELIKKGVSKLNFNTSEILVSVKEEENSATVLKTLNDFPVFDCGFNINYSDNGISKVSGTWFLETDKKTYIKHRSLISIFNEICENPKLHGKKITDITPGYKINISDEYQKEAVAYPIWRVTFEDKSTLDFNM
jgi:hypothetical protein